MKHRVFLFRAITRQPARAREGEAEGGSERGGGRGRGGGKERARKAGEGGRNCEGEAELTGKRGEDLGEGVLLEDDNVFARARVEEKYRSYRCAQR